MTILFVDDIANLPPYLARLMATDQASVVVFQVDDDRLQETNTLAELSKSIMLAKLEQAECFPDIFERVPMLGLCNPGYTRRRIIDNAEQSGANTYKRKNAIYFPKVSRSDCPHRYQLQRGSLFFCLSDSMTQKKRPPVIP